MYQFFRAFWNSIRPVYFCHVKWQSMLYSLLAKKKVAPCTDLKTKRKRTRWEMSACLWRYTPCALGPYIYGGGRTFAQNFELTRPKATQIPCRKSSTFQHIFTQKIQIQSHEWTARISHYYKAGCWMCIPSLLQYRGYKILVMRSSVWWWIQVIPKSSKRSAKYKHTRAEVLNTQ